VCGVQLVSLLNQLLLALMGSLQLGNLGAPTMPNPAFVAQITALQAQLQSVLSAKVFVAPA